jgi:hypothetical protein
MGVGWLSLDREQQSRERQAVSCWRSTELHMLTGLICRRTVSARHKQHVTSRVRFERGTARSRAPHGGILPSPIQVYLAHVAIPTTYLTNMPQYERDELHRLG